MSTNRERGVTFLHLTAAVAIASLTLLALARSYATTSGLNLDSRVNLRANEDLRRNLEAIANTLRGADFDTMVGMSTHGAVTALTFSSVEGMDRLGPQLGPAETITWRPATGTTETGARIGSLFHGVAGQERLLAARVPEAGFRASLNEGVLHLECRGHYVVGGKSVVVAGSTAILPRN